MVIMTIRRNRSLISSWSIWHLLSIRKWTNRSRCSSKSIKI